MISALMLAIVGWSAFLFGTVGKDVACCRAATAQLSHASGARSEETTAPILREAVRKPANQALRQFPRAPSSALEIRQLTFGSLLVFCSSEHGNHNEFCLGDAAAATNLIFRRSVQILFCVWRD